MGEGGGGGGEGARYQKNIGHHGQPTEKILGFEWAKMTKMALKYLRCFAFFHQEFFLFVKIIFANLVLFS